jgi:type II secretory pathway pseudopilin PulG
MRQPGAIGKVALGVGAVAIGAALLLPAIQGATRETAQETIAAGYLKQISLAEQQYKEQYGTFGALDDLARFEDSRALAEWLRRDDFPYTFTITVDGDTFTATARHKTRPDTRKAFIVGPDGAVKELKTEEPSGQ